MVSALFVRKDSIYKTLGIDSWDQERDARNFSGQHPIIAHPPCRLWGRLRAFANQVPGERELAILAVDLIRKNGGVLEHPQVSGLWKECNIPRPGSIDEFGGFSVCLDQHWFGHPARKKTMLYIVGCRPKDLPPMPLRFEAVQYTVGSSKGSFRGLRKECSIKDREATPRAFAEWMIQVARMCKR